MSHAPLPAQSVHAAAKKRLIKWDEHGIKKDNDTLRVHRLVRLAAVAQRTATGIVNVSSDDFALIEECWE